jgi:hypothetical protein
MNQTEAQRYELYKLYIRIGSYLYKTYNLNTLTVHLFDFNTYTIERTLSESLVLARKHYNAPDKLSTEKYILANRFINEFNNISKYFKIQL